MESQSPGCAQPIPRNPRLLHRLGPKQPHVNVACGSKRKMETCTCVCGNGIRGVVRGVNNAMVGMQTDAAVVGFWGWLCLASLALAPQHFVTVDVESVCQVKLLAVCRAGWSPEALVLHRFVTVDVARVCQVKLPDACGPRRSWTCLGRLSGRAA